MQIRQVINLHKGLTAPVVLGLMAGYHNGFMGPWIYLALHGIYGILWLFKDRLYSEGFFARCRNTNYLGEILIYLSFALLAMHWLPYAVLAGFIVGVFLPNMRRKDQSLSRYPEFAAYKKRSGLLLPRLGS